MTSRVRRAVRALRGVLFFILWIPYLLLFAGPFQRFIIWPVVLLFPARRARLTGAWLRLQGRVVLWLARLTALIDLEAPSANRADYRALP